MANDAVDACPHGTTMRPMTASANAIRELVPLLMVADIDRSAAFYRDKLGFQMTREWRPAGKLAWCRLVRDVSAVMLQQAVEEDGPADGRGHGVSFFFNCEDANRLHAELTVRGLTVAEPQAAFYGMNQIFLRDPDGYELCFQSAIAAE